MQCNLLTGLGEFLCVYFLCCLVKLFFSITRISSGNSCSRHLILAWHRAGGRLSLCGLSTATLTLSHSCPVLCSETGRKWRLPPGMGQRLILAQVTGSHSCFTAPSPGAHVTFRKYLLSFQGPERLIFCNLILFQS